MKKNKEALKENKLLSGLLDVYLKVAKAKSEADYKGIYEEYQELQR